MELNRRQISISALTLAFSSWHTSVFADERKFRLSDWFEKVVVPTNKLKKDKREGYFVWFEEEKIIEFSEKSDMSLDEQCLQCLLVASTNFWGADGTRKEEFFPTHYFAVDKRRYLAIDKPRAKLLIYLAGEMRTVACESKYIRLYEELKR